MGFFDRFKKRKSYRGYHKYFKDIHLKNYEDIKNYVDESEIDDLNEFFGYVEKTLELMILTRLMNMEWHVNFHPPYEYSQLEIYDYNDHSWVCC